MTLVRPASRRNRGGSSAGLAAFLALAAVGVGLYITSRKPEIKKPVVDDSLPQVEALARKEKETEWTQRAIRERQAILGMTQREVESAKGNPAAKERTETLTDAERAKGAVEKWVYRTASGEASVVLFGANGLVVYSSDVGENPRAGQAIRR